MIYTEMTKKAMNIMYQAHKEQYDKAGVPYVFHPWHLAEQMDDENATVVALLHDVVEDTNITLEDLQEEGFSQEVIAALSLLTHEKGMDYQEYIRQIGTNPLATKVKIADLRHNSDTTRLNEINAKIQERLIKYENSLNYLLLRQNAQNQKPPQLKLHKKETNTYYNSIVDYYELLDAAWCTPIITQFFELCLTHGFQFINFYVEFDHDHTSDGRPIEFDSHEELTSYLSLSYVSIQDIDHIGFSGTYNDANIWGHITPHSGVLSIHRPPQ